MRKATLVLIISVILLLAPVSAFAVETWSYFNVIGKALGLPVHVVCYLLVAILLVVMGLMVGTSYRAKLVKYEQWKKQSLDSRGSSPIDPSPNFSLSNFFEGLIQMVAGLMEDIIGHGSRKFFPIIGSLAFVILFNNLLVLLPGGNNATANVNTNAAMAITVFLLYHYFGIREHGVLKYLAHFMGPLEGTLKYILAPLMIPIELISHFVRPVSLSLRLFGNMFGDHTVFAVFMGLVAIPLIYPMPFLFLGTLVCVVQTLVFVLLSMVYISLAVAHDH